MYNTCVYFHSSVKIFKIFIGNTLKRESLVFNFVLRKKKHELLWLPSKRQKKLHVNVRVYIRSVVPVDVCNIFVRGKIWHGWWYIRIVHWIYQFFVIVGGGGDGVVVIVVFVVVGGGILYTLYITYFKVKETKRQNDQGSHQISDLSWRAVKYVEL